MENKDGVSFYGLLQYLLESKKIVLGVTIVSMIAASIYNFIVLKPVFGREIGVSISGEVDDRNLYNIILILESKKGEYSFVRARNIKDSSIIKLNFENTDKNRLQADSDEYKNIALQEINNYIINLGKIKQNKKDIEEIKQSLKFMVLSVGNGVDLNSRLALIDEKLDGEKIIGKATIFSESPISNQPLRPRRTNNIAAFTIFGFFTVCTVLIGKYYYIH